MAKVEQVEQLLAVGDTIGEKRLNHLSGKNGGFQSCGRIAILLYEGCSFELDSY